MSYSVALKTISRVASAWLVAVALIGGAELQAQTPGPNVNMVSGTSLPDGDPYLQRQNESTGAVSTRNPLHLLAGANDYRTVDIPIDVGNKEESNGDAWLGLFKSFDGGQSWHSSLLPGYPQDQTAVGLASPLRGFAAGADPTVRAGTNGLFYYSGLAFNRGTNGLGVVFVARLIDNNNDKAKYDKKTGKYLSNDPIAYIDTKVIDSGTAGRFADKPWLAVDIPRAGAGTCTIQSGGTTQTFKAGNVYISYIIAVGNDKNPVTQMMVARSTDCGATFSKPIKVSERVHISQGSTLAIDPNTGTVYLAWREIGDKTTSDAILIAKSTDFGKTFSAARTVRKITPFDQGGSNFTFRTRAFPTMAIDASGRVYLAWSQRGVGPASAAPIPGGVIPPAGVPTGDARIMLTTSLDGVSWTTPKAIDNDMGRRGHQIQPVLNVTAGKVTATFYDFRDDVSKLFEPYISDFNIGTRSPTHKRHTMDVWVWQANPAAEPASAGSVRVSQYVTGFRNPTATNLHPSKEQLQYNAPNLPLFGQGKIAFVGDYMDLFGLNFITTTDQTGQQKWVFNAAAGGPSATYAIWTDNRDVRPPKDGNWTNYTRATPGDAIPDAFKSPGAAQCVAGQTGMRNSNIYSSRITPGLYVGSPTNSKKLDGTLRSFVVFVQNTTDAMKTFRLTAPSATSWLQFGSLATVDITVAPRSTTSRTLYVTSAAGSLKVQIDELELRPKGSPDPTGVKADGLKAFVVLNPDVTNPDVTNPDVTNTEVFNPDVTNPDVTNPDVTNFSTTNPDVTNSNIKNPDVTNPDVTNPDVTNPDVTNPDVTNVSIVNPDVTNPDVTNPDVTNPDVTNPDVTNPDVTNPDVTNQSITDVTWTVTNNGTTAGSFAVKPFVTKNAPPGFLKQLILHKRYATPVTTNVGKAALDDCKVYTQVQNVLLANIIAPDVTNPDVTNPDVTNPDVTNPDVTNLVTNPDVTNASIWLDSGDSAQITMRVLNPDKTSNPVATKTVTQSNGKKQIVVVSPQFEAAKNATPLVASVAADTGAEEDSITFEAPLIVVTLFLPDAAASVPYASPVLASGGVVGPRTWCVLAPNAIPDGTCPATALPPAPGLTLDPSTGLISGSPTAAGAFSFTVQVRDTASPTPHYNTQDLFLRIAPTAVGDTKTTLEDQPLQFPATDLLANDPPVVANTTPTSLIVTSVTATPNTQGTVSLVGGVVTYVPLANYNGPASFTYTATLTTVYDGACCYPATNLVYPVLTGTGIVSLNIVSVVNDPPIPANDEYSTPEDTPLIVAASGVLTNDSKGPTAPAGTQDDELGQSLTSTVVLGPTHGQLTLNPNGSFTYSPTANYNGADSFSYRTCDNGVTNGAPDPKCVDATVNLTVTEVNDAPTTTADSQTTPEDTPLVFPGYELTGNDSRGPANESAQTLTVTAVTATATTHGSVVLEADGTVTYTPAADYYGAASFSYTVTDDGTTAGVAAPLTAIGTVNVIVTEVNDVPAGVNDGLSSVAEDSGLRTIGFASLLANDSKGPANEIGQALTITEVGAAVGGTVSISGTGVQFTPAAEFNGTASFVYTLRDDGTTNGGADFKTATATASFAVTEVNDAPTANDDAQDATEDVPLTLAAAELVANDNAGPGESSQTLTVTAVALQIASPAIPLAIGPFASAFTGPAVCRPGFAPPQCTAQPYNTSQNLAFGRPVVATSTIGGFPTIHAAAYVNDGFYGNGASWIGATANSSVTIDLGQEFWITRVSFGRDRTGSYNDREPGQFTISTSVDNVAFAPQFGSAAHAFGGIINGAETVEARLAPVRARWIRLTAGNAGAAVDEIEVYGSIGPPATVTQGAVTLIDGQVTFTPVANFNGATSFVYTACDDGLTNDAPASLCATAAVHVAVSAVNDAPVGVNDSYTTAEDAVLTVDASGANGLQGLLFNDSDVEPGTLIAVYLTDPAHGTLLPHANGSFSYTPFANYSGPDSFTYRASDGNLTSNVVTVSVTVTAVSDAPIALDQNVTTVEDTASAVTLVASDVDTPAGNLNFTVTAPPVHGSLSPIGPLPLSGLVSQWSAEGNANDTFGLNVGILQGTVDFAPGKVGQAFSFNGTDASVDLGNWFNLQEFTIDMWVKAEPTQNSYANIIDNDGTDFASWNIQFDNAVVAGKLQFHWGTVDNSSGPACCIGVNLTPGVWQHLAITRDAANMKRLYLDGVLVGLAQGTGAITYNGQSLRLGRWGGGGRFFKGLLDEVHVFNRALSAAEVVQSAGQIDCVPGAACVMYTPSPNYNGPDSFTYKANDGQADSNVATVRLTVDSVNDAPSFTKGPDQSVSDSAGGQVVTGWATSLSEGPPDEVDQTLEFLVSSDNDSLFLVHPAISPNGTLTFTPMPGAAGTAIVTVQLQDDGGTDSAGVDTSPAQTFTITVNMAAPTATITAVLPGAPSAGQMVTLQGTGLPPFVTLAEAPFYLRPKAFFTQGATTTEAQFVFFGDSSKLWVRLPFAGLVPGAATVYLSNVNNAQVSAPFGLTIGASPAAPIITTILPLNAPTTSQCGDGYASMTPTWLATPGQGIGVVAYGIDTTGATVVFTQGATVIEVNSTCGMGGAPTGLGVTVTVPMGLVPGPVSVSVKQTVFGTSALSTAVIMTVP